MKGCFLSSAKTWFKRTNTSPAVVITTGHIYFQLLFNLSSHRPRRSLYWSRADFQYMTAASIALTKLPFFSTTTSPIAVPLMSLHIGCLHACVIWNESSTPATCLIHYSELSVQQALHQNLAFMLDSAAPHAIRKSNIIDQSSNSRLFQQTRKKKENRFKLHSPVLSRALTDNSAFTSSSFFDCDSP